MPSEELPSSVVGMAFSSPRDIKGSQQDHAGELGGDGERGQGQALHPPRFTIAENVPTMLLAMSVSTLDT